MSSDDVTRRREPALAGPPGRHEAFTEAKRKQDGEITIFDQGWEANRIPFASLESPQLRRPFGMSWHVMPIFAAGQENGVF